MNSIVTWEDWLNSGELNGYDCGYINPIDDETAKEIPCEKCGGKCVAFGFLNNQGSYRVFSECQSCKRVIEF